MFERLEQRTLLTAELQPDGMLLVTGTDGDDDIRLFISQDQIVVRDAGGDTPFNLADISGIDIQAGDGNDHVQLDPDVPAADIEGQAGDDTLIGGDSDDTLEGGGGNDYMDGKGGADVMRGGTGFDTADYRFRSEDLNLSIDDAPNDGANGGGEGDNIHTDVERVMGGSGDDLIVGSDADNSLAAGAGDDTVLGGLGDDSIDGDDGDDWLIGEQGNDRLTGGPGRDLMEGRSGDDTFVAAQDGEHDTLEGGSGADTAESIDIGLDQVDDVENTPTPPGAGEIAVLRGLNELTDGQSVVDFGAVDRGDIATRTFTVRNDGKDTLTLGNVQVPDGFTLIEDLVGSLDAGQSDTFTIRIDSDTLGDKSGTVRISNSDANENPFTFQITGTVENAPPPRSPEITVLRNGNVIDDGQGTVGFGTVARGAGAPQQTFVVRNDGSQTLDLGNLFVPNGFVIVDDLVGSLAPGDSDQFTIRMSTSSVGTFSGQIHFSDNDSDENPFVIAVSGTVQNQAPPPSKGEITILLGSHSLSSGAGAIKFGKATLNGNSPSKTFTVRNDGGGTLSLGGVFVPRGFAVVDGLPSSLGAGQSDSLTIRHVTSKAGAAKGSVRVNSNDSNENPFVIKVNGSVGRPKIAKLTLMRGSSRLGNGSKITFPTVARGKTSKPITFTVRNDGTAKLALGSVRAPSGFILSKALAKSLLPHKSATFSVHMDTRSGGSKNGSLTIGTGSTAITINLRGTVTTPTPPPPPPPGAADIAVFNGSTNITDGSTSAINFGSITAGGSTRSISFRVTNNGGSTLRINGVTVPSGFSVTDGLGSTIAPGASDTLTIRLDSSSAGTRSGNVNISSNDGDENPFNFAITGKVNSSGGSVNAFVDSARTLIITGTSGSDSIVVKGSGSSVNVTMNGASATFNNVKKIAVQGGEGNDTISLSATSLPSAVDGGGGFDTITGGGGADTLHGGSGNDSIVGGFGADQLFGDDGDDKIDAVDGTPDPKVDGGAGNDTIKADPTDSRTGT